MNKGLNFLFFFIIGIFILLDFNGFKFLKHLKESMEVRIFLSEEICPDSLREEIEKKEGIDRLIFISKDHALREFQKEFEKHQKLSRSASVGKFKGGLGDHSSKTIEYHTATHLLHRALRDVLGEHVEQRGSNITRERLRFDFSHGAKLADDEIRKVEEIVNQKIKDRLDVKQKEMSVEEAEKQDAIGIFRDKYGKRVKIYSIGNYSKEICGGPHVNNTSELGYFKIIKEESCSAGVRRIKAVLQ